MHQKRTNITRQSDNYRILLVDDVDSIREPVKAMLERNDYIVDVAVNGIDSVLACVHYRYDLILMTINLPYMDGMEAVIHLRKVSELNLQTEIILLSSDAGENVKRSMEQVGIKTMVVKPVDLLLLEKTVNESIKISAQNESDQLDRPRKQKRRIQDSDLEPSESPVDEDVITRLIEDTNKEICREMVDMFIEESLASISELENCCQSGDWIGAASHAHNISSSCQTFGCEALSGIAIQLELESEKNNMGECIHLATLLPQVFLKSQQSLYNIFQRIEDQ